ncbi:MAG: G5 domain-containing protein [Clostridia bacterium]|nr:G5 domain-containing protein [Clostridia bacterium]
MLRFNKSGFSFAKLLQMRMPLVAMLLIAAICAATLLFGTVNTFTVTDGEKTHKVHTLSADVESAITVAGFNSDKYKVLSVSAADNMTNIALAYTFPVYITVGEKTVETYAIESTVGTILKDAGYNVDQFDMVEPSLDTVISDTAYIDYTNIDYITGSYTEAIPCTVKTVYSSKLDAGTTTLTEGKDGEQQVNYTAKVVNGVTVETVVDSRITLSEAVNGTKTVGTKKAAVKTSENVKSISTLTPSSPIELDANGNPVNFKKHITVQATAYTYTGNKCSTGVAPQPGYIAVNPDVIPYGTKMYIKSSDGSYIYGYAVAADTGGFINSRPNNVDLFITSKAACTAFGRRNVEIYILE